MLEGACEPARFLRLLRDFIVFEDEGGVLAKKMAGYHQFHAVETAVAETLRAAELHGLREAREGRYESGRQPGGVCRRPPHRCRLAHTRIGEEPDDGLLRWPHHPRAGYGEPHRRRADRPE